MLHPIKTIIKNHKRNSILNDSTSYIPQPRKQPGQKECLGSQACECRVHAVCALRGVFVASIVNSTSLVHQLCPRYTQRLKRVVLLHIGLLSHR